MYFFLQADQSGTIVEVLVEDRKPVSMDTVSFLSQLDSIDLKSFDMIMTHITFPPTASVRDRTLELSSGQVNESSKD